MRRRRDLVGGLALCLAGVLGLAVLSGGRMPMAGMGMMGKGGMMDRMMGGQLPPGTDPADLPDPASPGARLLARYCTQCHGLPDPGLHTTTEWPEVVARMKRTMAATGKEVPDGDALAGIVGYLKDHAKGP